MKKIYIAFCIEDGERFTSTFKSSETNKEKLREIGEELASEWGAECTSVREWKPEFYLKVTNKKTGKETKTTTKQWDKWNNKHYPNLFNNHPSHPYTVISDGQEPEPEDVYDYDVEKAKEIAKYASEKVA